MIIKHRDILHKIKEIRLHKQHDQAKIASELGMSQKAYSYIENGKTKLNVEH